MRIVSDVVKIKKTDDISVEYIENELEKLQIVPLRWAIVDFDCDFLTISYSAEQTN